MTPRFTLIHNEVTRVIAEPGGWQDHEISLERHPEFCSIIESIFSEDRFVLIGNDDEDGDGGIDFVRDIESGGKLNEKIELLIEYAPDDVNFEEYFRGLLQLEGLLELPENELEVPVVREDSWSRFISRMDKPVDVMSTVDMDGNEVTPLEPVTVNLTSQVIRKKFDGYLADTRTFDELEVSTSDYIQFDVDTYLLDEFEDKHTFAIATNPEVPQGVISVEDDGAYAFDLRIEASIIRYNTAGVYPDCSIDRDVIGSASYMNVYIQINDEDPEAFTENSSPLIFENISTIYTYTGSKTLKKGDQIKIYGDMVGNISDEGNAGATLFIHSANGIGSIMVPQAIADVPSETCGFLPASEPTNVAIAAPSLEEFPTYFKITADTVYPETQVQGFWAHDVADAIIRRIAPGYDGIYSEILGAQYTAARQYDLNGCYANFFLARGVHIRGYTLGTNEDDPISRYTLQQKPFTLSWNDWWEGMNPIFNLGMGYETLGDTPESNVIRIEGKDHFYDTASASVNFNNVYSITREYDKDYIFKIIKTGFNKWESESFAGLDDPQTRHTYGTIISNPSDKGKGEKIIHSDFIAASLTWETTRRTTIKKSSDYKYDNDTFILAVNVEDISPEASPFAYVPELDENFNSVSNLLHSDTRYNMVLTPMRSLFRWANYLIGCLQAYTDSSIKFLSGEGNFDMISDYDCSGGVQCQAVICDELAESADISLTSYNSAFGFLHLALLYNIQIPMEWDEYKQIRDNRKKAIGISQTDTGHTKFYIKKLTYNPMSGQATIQAWPKEYFEIQQIDFVPEVSCGPEPEEGFDDDYQSLLDFAESLEFALPSTGQQELQNQLVLDLKAAGIWDELDLLYVFATDGDEDFARLNWKDPASYNADHGAMGAQFTQDEGFKGNGSDQSMTTNWDPANDGVQFTLDDSSAFVYSNTNLGPAGSNFLFGSRGAANAGRVELIPKNISSLHVAGLNSTATTTGLGSAPVSSKGFFHVQRTADDELRLFKDGSQVGSTSTAASDVLNDDDIVLFATNADGSIGSFSEEQIGMFGLGASLAGKEAALYEAWDSYFANI